MSKKILIKADNLSVEAELRSDSAVAEAIWDVLPFKGCVSRWEDRLFFSMPLSAFKPCSDLRVGEGDLGYWPVGNAFCIFLGEREASKREGSSVSVFGHLQGDLEGFKQLRHGEIVRVMKKLKKDVS